MDWGDGQHSVLQNYNVNPMNTVAIKHTYNSIGFKAIKVSGISPTCFGTASKRIYVSFNKLAPESLYTPTNKIKSISGGNGVQAFKVYKIKVNGTGKCSKMRVYWGDGKSTLLNNYNLASPSYISHTYFTVGQKTIKAKAVAGCSGLASKKVTVNKFKEPKPGKPGSGYRLQ